MKKLKSEIAQFFRAQGCVIVSTIDSRGNIHGACKGIVDVEPGGRVYLFDLYHGMTYANLQRNARVSIVAVDDHRFTGYCLKGTARIVAKSGIPPRILKAWEERVTDRLTRRIIRNIREERGHPRHPEALMPEPKYLIVMDVEEIVDLTPHQMK